MAICCVVGCSNRSDGAKNEKISFHKFPKGEGLRKRWILAVGRKNWQPTKASCICSKHFTEDQIDRTSKSKVRLREGAVPTIFDGYPSYFKEINKKIKVYDSVTTTDGNSIPDTSKTYVPYDNTSSNAKETVILLSSNIPCHRTDIATVSNNPTPVTDDHALSQIDSILSSSAEEMFNLQDKSSVVMTNAPSVSPTAILCDVPLPIEITNSALYHVPSFVSEVAKIVCSPSENAKENISKIVCSYPNLERIQKAISAPPSAETISGIDKIKLLKKQLKIAISWNAKYSKKRKLLEQIIACQEKKLEHLKHVAASIKRNTGVTAEYFLGIT